MSSNNLYLFPILVSIIIIFINIIFSQKIKYDKRFTSDLSNRLYALSFLKPFSWFINPDEKDPRVRKEEEMIKKAGFGEKFNYRSFMTFQVIIFILILLIYIILVLFMEQLLQISNFVFRIENVEEGNYTSVKLLLGVILMSVLLIPKYYMKNKVKKNNYLFIQELPVVQLSIILMLRAKRPMNDIMYTLGNSQTRYKHIFQKAHRIYLRNKDESWRYLRDKFKDTGLDDTFEVLSNMDQYSREETIRVLDNGMEVLVDKSSKQKKNGAALGNLFSQFSMAIPFGGLMLLGAIPFAMYIFEMMTTESVF